MCEQCEKAAVMRNKVIEIVEEARQGGIRYDVAMREIAMIMGAVVCVVNQGLNYPHSEATRDAECFFKITRDYIENSYSQQQPQSGLRQ